jgi:DNA-binding transcriptional LysR family regulator
MDLEELRAFVAVAETGSYLAAADSLAMSRTTLRRKVDSLEARAGVALLEGTPRGIVLTDAGKALASQGHRMMQEMRAVLSSVRDMGSTPRGTLRAVMPVGMPPELMPQLIAMIRAKFPALHLHCRFSSDPLGEPLEEIDLAVHFTENSPGAAWVSFPMVRLQRSLLASSSYLASHGTPRSLAELAAHEIYAWQAPGEDACELPTRDGARYRIAPVVIGTDMHIIRRSCAAGLAMAFIPDAGLPEPFGGEPLVRVLPEQVGAELRLWISAPRVLAEIPKIRLVLELLRSFVGGL